MALPLFDPIQIPPDAVLVDVHSLTPDAEREKYQGLALELWIEETGEGPEDFAARYWDDNEGIFVVKEGDTIVGVAVITDVENA